MSAGGMTEVLEGIVGINGDWGRAEVFQVETILTKP